MVAFEDIKNSIRERLTGWRLPKWGMVILLVIGVLIVGGGGWLGYQHWQQSHQTIPLAIQKQIPFIIFWPDKAAPVTPEKQTVKFDPTNKLLSYVALTNDGTKLIISEQSTPEIFSDVPQAYDKLTATMRQYGSFDTINGKVFLTHPKDLQGGQSAVMNTKGTLMFIKPEKDLSSDTWHLLFNNLQIIH